MALLSDQWARETPQIVFKAMAVVESCPSRDISGTTRKSFTRSARTKAASVNDRRNALQLRSMALRAGGDALRVDSHAQRGASPQIVAEIMEQGVSDGGPVRALGAGEPSHSNESVDLRLRQCNRHATQTLPSACAMNAHPKSRRRIGVLFSCIPSHPSRAWSRVEFAPSLQMENIKASLRWEPAAVEKQTARRRS